MTNKDEIKRQILSYFEDKGLAEGVCLLLHGSWGSGKTYFWENELKPEFKKKFDEDPVIYMSCFGIESTETFQKTFYNSYIARFSDSGKSDILGKAVDVVTKGTLGFVQKQIKEKSGLELDLKIDPFSLVAKEIIFCLDDLERRGSGLPVDFILGFISKLMREKNAKILLIADESTILLNGNTNRNATQTQKNESNIYKAFKEKVIKKSLGWRPTIDEILNATFRKFEKSPSVFKSAKEQVALAIKKAEIKNYRTIYHIADHIHNLSILYPKVEFTENFFYTLAVYTIENDLGNLGDRSFYKKTNPVIVEMHKRNRKKLTVFEKKESIFLHKYFTGKFVFSHFNCAYDLVESGTIDADNIDLEFPKKKANSKTQNCLQDLQGTKAYFGNEKTVQKILKNAEKILLSESKIKASEILYVYSHYKRISNRFGHENDLVTPRVEKRLDTLAKKADRSITEDYTIHFSNHPWSIELIESYLATLDAALKKLRVMEIKRQFLSTEMYPEFIHNVEDCIICVENLDTIFGRSPVTNTEKFYLNFNAVIKRIKNKAVYKSPGSIYLDKFLNDNAVDSYTKVTLKEVKNFLNS